MEDANKSMEDASKIIMKQRFDVATLNTSILTPSVSRPMRCDDLAYKQSDTSLTPSEHILRDIQFLVFCANAREGNMICTPGLDSGMRTCRAVDPLGDLDIGGDVRSNDPKI